MKKKPDVKQKGKKVVSETKNKEIVISETEDDIILGGAIKGDPDDFKEEVRKEAERGKFFRAITPILAFLLLGALVAYGTMYYKNQSDDQGTKKTEDKIQTPPAVNKDAEAETSTEPTTPPPTTTPTTPPVTTPTSGYTEYTVVSGDTLSGIANAHDMTSAALAQYNGITAETVLQIGQKLKIPNN